MADDAFDLSINDLTIDEIDEVEQHVGVAIDSVFDGTAPRAKALRAIAWVVKRRDDPTFTLEDAGKLRINLATREPDPTSASAS